MLTRPDDTAKREGLRAVWWASLSDAERVRFLSEKRARKAAAIARAARINDSILAGKTAEEIAESEGMTVRNLRSLRKRWPILPFSRNYGFRRISILVPCEFMDALDEMAVDMKTDPQDALSELAKWGLQDDARPARRELRVPRRVRQLEAVA